MNISFPRSLQGLLKKKCKQYLYKNCISPKTKREASWSKEKKNVLVVWEISCLRCSKARRLKFTCRHQRVTMQDSLLRLQGCRIGDTGLLAVPHFRLFLIPGACRVSKDRYQLGRKTSAFPSPHGWVCRPSAGHFRFLNLAVKTMNQPLPTSPKAATRPRHRALAHRGSHRVLQRKSISSYYR